MLELVPNIVLPPVLLVMMSDLRLSPGGYLFLDTCNRTPHLLHLLVHLFPHLRRRINDSIPINYHSSRVILIRPTCACAFYMSSTRTSITCISTSLVGEGGYTYQRNDQTHWGKTSTASRKESAVILYHWHTCVYP